MESEIVLQVCEHMIKLNADPHCISHDRFPLFLSISTKPAPPLKIHHCLSPLPPKEPSVNEEKGHCSSLWRDFSSQSLIKRAHETTIFLCARVYRLCNLCNHVTTSSGLSPCDLP